VKELGDSTFTCSARTRDEDLCDFDVFKRAHDLGIIIRVKVFESG
jgi:hypothetical protein